MGPTLTKRADLSPEQAKTQADALKVMSQEIFGRAHGRKLSRFTAYHYATVMRWFNGDLPIPPIIWTLLTLLKRTPRHYWEDILTKAMGQKESS